MAGNLSEISDRYLAARALVDELNDALKDAKADKDAAEKALVDAMVSAGITSFKTEDGVGLRAQREERWSCPAENKDALYAVLRENPDLQRMFVVQPQTLHRFAKDMAERNGGKLEEPYADLLKLYDEEVAVRVDGFKKWKGGD